MNLGKIWVEGRDLTRDATKQVPTVMDEQDEIDMLKATIKAKSEAILRLKRDASVLLRHVDAYCNFRSTIRDKDMIEEREALRKALSEIN